MNHFGDFYWCSICLCLHVYVWHQGSTHSLGYTWLFISHLCNLCQTKLKFQVFFPGCEVCWQIMLEGFMQSTLVVLANDWCCVCSSFLTGECFILAVWSHTCWEGDVPFDPMKLACRVGFMTSPLSGSILSTSEDHYMLKRRWYLLAERDRFSYISKMVEKIQITGYSYMSNIWDLKAFVIDMYVDDGGRLSDAPKPGLTKLHIFIQSYHNCKEITYCER